ncbi:MAG: L-threonylcarbamoyladenylate synthase [Nitrospiraceae bacterium]
MAALTSRGGIVALPTESSFALCASPFDEQAVQQIFALKGRPDGKPLLVLIGAVEQVPRLVGVLSPVARDLMTALWPGPLTLVLPAVPTLSTTVTAGTGTIGVRLPPSEPLRTLLQRTGPLTGTSANRAGEAPLHTAADVSTYFPSIDLVVDLEPTGGAAASTIAAVQQHEIVLLRPGPVTIEQVRAVAKRRGINVRVA